MMHLRPRLGLALLALAVLTAACAKTDAPAGFEKAVRRQHDYFYLNPLDPMFTKEKDESGRWTFVSRRPIEPPYPRFTAVKEKGVKRVFLIGGSVVQIFDEDILRAALERALPGTKFELIDCGLTAYDSARDRLVLEEVLGYDPDLIILMSGVNEAEQPGSSSLRRLPLLARTVLRGLTRGRLPSAARLAWAAVRPQATPGKLTEEFEENIRAMLDAAGRRGVPVLLTALSWNIRDMPPNGALDLEEEEFFDAWLSFEEGDYAAAIGRLRASLPLVEDDLSAYRERAFGNYYLARALDKSGDPEAARAQYLATMEVTTPPLPALNRVLRRLSRERNIPLADVDESFALLSPHGLTGSDLFEDDMHWDSFLDPLVADLFVKALHDSARRGGPSLAPAGQWGGKEPGVDIELYRRLAQSVPRRREKAWVVFRYRAWSSALAWSNGLSERVVALMDVVHDTHPELLSSIVELKSWLRERLSGNIWDSEAAEHLDAWWPALLAHVGEVYLRRARTRRALELFDEALRLDGNLTVVRVRRAVALARCGRKEEAAKELDVLKEHSGRFPEIVHYRKNLGRLRAVQEPETKSGGTKVADLKHEGSRILDRLKSH